MIVTPGLPRGASATPSMRAWLERKGAGIIFALPVTRTLGLYEERAHKKAVDK